VVGGGLEDVFAARFIEQVSVCFDPCADRATQLTALHEVLDITINALQVIQGEAVRGRAAGW
jgi:hypothetical protein